MVCSFSGMPAFSNRLTLLKITMVFTEHRCFVDDFEDKDDHDWDSGLEGQRDLATEEDHHDDCNDQVLVTMIITLVTMIMILVTMIMTDSPVQSSDILVSDLPNQRVPRACCGPVPSQGRKDDHPHHFDRHHRRDHDDHHSNDIFTNTLLPSMLKLKN